MADTVVRVYNLKPDDIQVRRSSAPDDEVILQLGDIVTIQGVPAQLHTLLKLANLRIDGIEATMSRASGPF